MTEFDHFDEEMLATLRQTFLEEAHFLVEDLQEQIIDLESAEQKEVILGNILRIIHSINSSAESVGFQTLSAFSNEVEDCLSVMRSYPELVDTTAITILLDCCDMQRNMIEGLIKVPEDDASWELTELVTKIRKLIKDLTEPREVPSLGDILVKRGQATRDQVQNAIDRQIEARNKRFGEYLTEVAEIPKKVIEDAISVQEIAKQNLQEREARPALLQSMLKINATRVDNVMDMVGELVVIKSLIMQNSSLSNISDAEATGLLSLFDKTVRELYDRALSMRMTSLQSIFVKLQRTIRDLSEQLHKPVELSIEGESTELDRLIIDHLSNPLVHLCRNAIDHGLEEIEVRKQKGKSLTGKIKIEAYKSGGSVILQISDDGAGIDKKKVFEKGLVKGLIPPNSEFEAFTEQELFDFLFHPGFSTVDKVTSVSGRGVGLDIVKSSVEELKGKISLESKLEVGTTFCLTLPITAAITDGILIASADERYILPIEVISEFVTIDKVSVTDIGGESEMIELRGEFIPLARLGYLLTGKQTQENLIAIVETRKGRLGLSLKHVYGQSQVVLKRLSESLGTTDGVSGAAILGDGKVGLVLDVNVIYDLHFKSQELAA